MSFQNYPEEILDAIKQSSLTKTEERERERESERERNDQKEIDTIPSVGTRDFAEHKSGIPPTNCPFLVKKSSARSKQTPHPEIQNLNFTSLIISSNFNQSQMSCGLLFV
jgi:hypothetical protein